MSLDRNLQSILNSIQNQSSAARITGCPSSFQAYLLAHLFGVQDNLTVLVCPDLEIAETLVSDFTAIGSHFHFHNNMARLLPTWDSSPYSAVSPSIRVRNDRLRALTSVQEGTTPFIVTTLAALFQLTLSPSLLKQHTLRLLVGSEPVGGRSALIQALLSSGYLKSDPVEDPGTYSVRGDILDVFPPQSTNPVRIEFFGDEIEKIREFDPSSQRTIRDLTEIKIPPAREVLINTESVTRIRERIKQQADDEGTPRTVRDPILSGVQEGMHSTHADVWAPFAYSTECCFLDYLDADTQFIFVDHGLSVDKWKTFGTACRELSSIDRLRSGTILPTFDDLYPRSAQRLEWLESKASLYLGGLDLTKSIAGVSPLVLNVESNSDLGNKSKRTLDETESRLHSWLESGQNIHIFCSTQSHSDRIQFLLRERKLPLARFRFSIGSLSCGFRWLDGFTVALTDHEILGTTSVSTKRTHQKASSSWAGLQALSDLSVGDYLVHVDHGIARYRGLIRLQLSGAPSDFLQLEFNGGDKLYLPVYRLNVVQRYASEGASVTLDRLGTQTFLKAKQQVQSSVKALAIDLIKLYAERAVRPGIAFSGRDAVLQEFEARFPFAETQDQQKAIDDTLGDLESGKAMDRLICGDVGYGKTEVAMRAAFRVASEGRQVAVLVPTTVLAQQHELSFKARFKDYPFLIESVSRFKSSKDQKQVLESLSHGKIDVIIGTHRLLSKDVKFKNLGLIIVDEEHRFGVEHKERLKVLSANTHVLTLSATPIPRTLHMALSGLRDISLINTPPIDRLPIRTVVAKYDEQLIQEAITLELNRGGQVFFLHNRVENIEEVAATLRGLVSHAKIGVAHGQMGETLLERTMYDFYQKKTNVLICTSIIESGLDIPSANTLIVSRADALGLSQLYQIRGRVGRGQTRAYAYFLIPSEQLISGDARRRLEVMQRFVELGSGFSIASHDLEIRGGGDLLGASQSGHIASVGFDLYTELLETAIQELRGTSFDDVSKSKEPEIKSPFPSFLPEEYVSEVHQRLSLYRRLSGSTTDQQLDELEEEMRDRYGNLPIEAKNLLWIIRIKQLLKNNGIEQLTIGPKKISLSSGTFGRLDPVKAISLAAAHKDLFQLLPDNRFVATMNTENLNTVYFEVESLINKITLTPPSF